MLISTVKLVRTETYLTTENPGTLHAYPGIPAVPVPVLLRWAQSYILHTAHAAPAHPISVPDPGGFPRHSHHHRPDGIPPKPQKAHREFVHFSHFLSFRDGCDDSDGVFDGIIFTVATVAIVAPLILRSLYRPSILPAYKPISPVAQSVWPCFRSPHGTLPAACRI